MTADQTALTNAETAQASAALKDQQSIQAAENAATNAENSQTATALKDQQSIQAAQNALTNAQTSQQATALKDSQSVQADQVAVTNAQNSLQAGEMKDQQSIANAENSQASTAANNASREAVLPTTVQADQSGVDSADAQLTNAQINYAGTVLTAPVAGTVSTINGEVGEVAGVSSTGSSSSSGASASSTSSAGSAGSGFITLTDLATLQVEAGFAETDAAKIELGQPATVTFNALPNQQLQGKVSEIDVNSETVSNVVTYNVTVSIVNPPPSLKPGMTANVAVTTAEANNVVQLPSSAITATSNTTTVSVLLPTGKTAQRAITIGLKGDTADQITSGLNVGDKVVVTLARRHGRRRDGSLPDRRAPRWRARWRSRRGGRGPGMSWPESTAADSDPVDTDPVDDHAGEAGPGGNGAAGPSVPSLTAFAPPTGVVPTVASPPTTAVVKARPGPRTRLKRFVMGPPATCWWRLRITSKKMSSSSRTW